MEDGVHITRQNKLHVTVDAIRVGVRIRHHGNEGAFATEIFGDIQDNRVESVIGKSHQNILL
ncbi:hypothetical protein [Vibrio vulnificus YJ016]|uniref:Uncharacterized protein n=1 Tax=Vibrio vulnificus (strain YJ016) TaxID=196600 RepID=Q7MJB3_VIBVY|nr:hypothetical protein [Vibrio vulnificus YJ016]